MAEDIYNGMREGIKRVRQISNPVEGERGVADITALALIDIAESLRTMAFSLARGSVADAIVEPATAAPVEPIKVGDWVAPESSEPGVPLLGMATGVVTETGTSEGEAWAEVDGIGRVWSAHLIKVATPELTADNVDEPDPTDHVEDDIDTDFAGDQFAPVVQAPPKKAKKKGGKK